MVVVNSDKSDQKGTNSNGGEIGLETISKAYYLTKSKTYFSEIVNSEAMVPAPIIIKLPVGTKKLTAENMKQISNLQVPAQQQQVQQHHQIPVIKLEDLETLQTLDHRDQEYDNRIAERTPIDELRAGKHILPIWADGLFDQTPPGQPRRRRKLTHLTAGEKILRRKLKNRVAAQNARDKKKTAYEDLRSDNEELRAMMEELRRTQQEQMVIFFCLN